MHQELHQRIREALNRVPITAAPEGRDTLLEGIPKALVEAFNRYPTNKQIDLAKLIEQLDQLGQLEANGIQPLVIFLENARRTVALTLPGRILQDLIQELEQQDEEDIAPLAPSITSRPTTPEVFVFGGSDERLPYAFFEKALSVQKSIVRLHVPRCFGTSFDGKHGFGTGWVIGSQLVLTNYHVINARRASEASANSHEFCMQAEKTMAWFDHHTETQPRKECPCVELVYANEHLDYALLRLDPTSELANRPALTILRQETLFQADRLNIVQHPGGRILRYAIRNNFYIGFGETEDFIHYLTDTEGGASGSPVFNDDWLVVAMHHAAYEVRPESYKGETITYHNEGIEIHAILNNLPQHIQQEIFQAQGW